MPNRRTSSILLAALLVLSGAAFLRAEQLKLERSPIARPRVPKFVSTVCRLGTHNCARGRHGVKVGFRLRSAGTVSLAIVDAGGRVVDQLSAPQAYRSGPVSAVWRLHTTAGRPVPEATYYLRIDLSSLGRTITLPDPLIIDDTPPTIAVTSAPGTLPVRYRTSEPGRVYGTATVTGAAGIHRTFPIRCRGGRVLLSAARRIPAGAVVTLRLVAFDRAGNHSHATVVTGVHVPA